jgi:integrase
MVERVEQGARGGATRDCGEDNQRGNGPTVGEVGMPPGSAGRISVTGRTEGREDVEIGVGGTRREGLVGMDDECPAALLAESVGGVFPGRLWWVSLAPSHKRDFVQCDVAVGVPDLKVRGVMTGPTVRSDEGNGEGLTRKVSDGRVTFQDEDEDTLKLRFELDEPTTLVCRHATAITAEADDPPDIAGRGPTGEGHTKPPCSDVPLDGNSVFRSSGGFSVNTRARLDMAYKRLRRSNALASLFHSGVTLDATARIAHLFAYLFASFPIAQTEYTLHGQHLSRLNTCRLSTMQTAYVRRTTMPKRRARGEGTLTYDEARKRWIYYLPPDETGKRQRVSGKTQAEVLAKAEQLKNGRAQGLDLDTKQPTIEQFGEVWLRDVVRRTRRDSTYDSYSQMIRLYINPRLGKIRLATLTAARVQAWVNDLVDTDLSPSTVRNAYLRLRGMLDVAVRYRLINANPAADVELPAIGNDSAKALTLAAAQALLAAADGRLDRRERYTTKNGRTKRQPAITTRIATLYHVLLALGLRRGEALGLHWSDIDWDDGTVRIQRQVQLIKSRVVMSDYTKTDAGQRLLPLAPELLARLRAHQQNQEEERTILGEGWKPNDLVFASETGGPVNPPNLNRHFSSVLACAGVSRIRLHDLRHTCATLLGERTSDRVIAAILGHTPGTVTARYAKVTLNQMREALDALYRALIEDEEGKGVTSGLANP